MANAPHVTSVDDDFILPFQVGDTALRGRVVRLSGAIDEILTAHSFPQKISELVGEAVCLSAMMGAALKFDGKLIFQAQSDGPVSMLVADYTTGGSVRATAKFDADAIDAADKLIGKGHIVMTVDQGTDMERYQGVTALEGDSLAEAAIAYFDQSEQIPTMVRLAVGRLSAPGEPERWRAGGVMVQFVPGEGGVRERGEEVLMDGDEQELWERAAAYVQTTQTDELIDPAITAETLLFRLFHDDGVRVFDKQPVKADCSCNNEKIAAVLGRYSEEDLVEMVEDDTIKVTCEFCRKDYLFTPQGQPV